MLQVCSRISTYFASTQKYVIKKGQYLIEAPPKKPSTSFGFFVAQKLAGQKGSAATSLTKSVGAEWKKLSEKDKAVYQAKSQKLYEEYYKEKSVYEQKYVTPFKKVNAQNIAMKHIYATQKIPADTPFEKYSKIVTEHMKKITPEQQKQFSKEAQQLTNQRNNTISKFMFPNRLYYTQVGHTRAHPDIYPAQRARAYRIYMKKWEGEVKAWLSKTHPSLKISEFMRLYNRTLRNEEKKKQEQEEEKLAEKKAKAAEKRAKRLSSVSK